MAEVSRHVCLTVAYDQFLETELGNTAHLCSSTTARSPAGDTAITACLAVDWMNRLSIRPSGRIGTPTTQSAELLPEYQCPK